MSQPINQDDLPKLFESLKHREFFGRGSIEFNRGQPKLVRIGETKLIQEAESRHAYRDRQCEP